VCNLTPASARFMIDASIRNLVLPRRRRWLQFSMRSMFVLTTLLAVLISVVGLPLFRLRQQLRAVQSLEKAGADITSQGAEGVLAALAGKLFGDEAAVHVTKVVWDRAE